MKYGENIFIERPLKPDSTTKDIENRLRFTFSDPRLNPDFDRSRTAKVALQIEGSGATPTIQGTIWVITHDDHPIDVYFKSDFESGIDERQLEYITIIRTRFGSYLEETDQ